MTEAKNVLAIELLHPDGRALLDRRPDIRYRVIPDLAEAELVAEVGSADAIIVRNTRITEAVIVSPTLALSSGMIRRSGGSVLWPRAAMPPLLCVRP